MMEVKNGEILVAKTALTKIMDNTLPVSTSLAIVALSRLLDEQYSIITTVKDKLIRQYGVDDGKGNITVKENSPNWDKFLNESTELLEQSVEINYKKVKWPPDCPIQPNTIIGLTKFIEV